MRSWAQRGTYRNTWVLVPSLFPVPEPANSSRVAPHRINIAADLPYNTASIRGASNSAGVAIAQMLGQEAGNQAQKSIATNHTADSKARSHAPACTLHSVPPETGGVSMQVARRCK